MDLIQPSVLSFIHPHICRDATSGGDPAAPFSFCPCARRDNLQTLDRCAIGFFPTLHTQGHLLAFARDQVVLLLTLHMQGRHRRRQARQEQVLVALQMQGRSRGSGLRQAVAAFDPCECRVSITPGEIPRPIHPCACKVNAFRDWYFNRGLLLSRQRRDNLSALICRSPSIFSPLRTQGHHSPIPLHMDLFLRPLLMQGHLRLRQRAATDLASAPASAGTTTTADVTIFSSPFHPCARRDYTCAGGFVSR